MRSPIMRTSTLLPLLSGLLLLCSCGGDGGTSLDAGTGDAGGDDGSCTVEVTAPLANPSADVDAVAKGTITCTTPHDLHLEVCLQWEVDGVFEDVSCSSRSSSDVTELREQAPVACLGTKTFRTRVAATADGAPLDAPPSESVVVSCQ